MVSSTFPATIRDRIQLSGTLLSAAIGLCVAGSAWAQSGISQYPYRIQGVDNPGWSPF
jgi:hypothetical protein